MRTLLLLLASCSPFFADSGYEWRPKHPHLMEFIEHKEGYDRMFTTAWRNNNPGNLVYHHQPGAVRGERGFAKFSSPIQGMISLDRDLDRKIHMGIPLKMGWDYLK